MIFSNSSMKLVAFVSMAAVAMLAWAVLPVLAQEGGGHALDANPEVGSGGRNTAAQVPDFNYGNDIVSGNVGDKYFRGQVPYRSSRDFGTSLPSDDQFRFRANSLPSAAGTQFRDAGYGNNNIAVYRSFADSTAGGLDTNSPATFSLGGTSTIYSNRGIETGRNFLTTPGAQVNPRMRTIGGFSDGETITTMQATPFLGMRQSTSEVESSDAPPVDSLETSSTGDGFYDPTRFDRSMRIDRSTSFTLRSQLSPEEQLEIRTAGEQIGERLMRGVQPQDQDDARDYAVGAERALSRLNRLVNDPNYDPEQASDGDSAYAKIIDDIRKGQQKTEEYFRPNLDGSAYQPVEVPSSQEISRARADRMRKMRELGLLPPEITDLTIINEEQNTEESTDGQTPDNESQETDDTSMSEADRILAEARKILQEIDVEVPEVMTLAGQRDSQINDLYRKAEQRMADGKYFDAEESYRSIIVLDKDQPLAEIGMVNAMIGAGLTRSAAQKLREVLMKHPELITVRYKATLLPEPKRLAEVEASLRNVMRGQGERAARASLLLAYIGYQVRSVKMTEYGLLIGQTRDPRDPIWQVLQNVWLDEQTSQSLELPRIEE